MKNPFKQIIEDKELPEAIKEKVVNDINLIKLSLELSELFLVSMPDVMLKFMDTEKKDKPDEENSADSSEPTSNK